MAEDEEEAQDIHPNSLGEVGTFAIEAMSVDSDWWDAIPYNATDDKTCGQLLKEQRLRSEGK